MLGHMPQGDEVRYPKEGEDGNEEDVFPRNDEVVEMIEKDVVADVIKEMEGNRDNRGIKEHRKVATPCRNQENERLLDPSDLYGVGGGEFARIKKGVSMRGGEQNRAEQNREGTPVFPFRQIKDQANKQIDEEDILENGSGEIRRAFHEHQSDILRFNAQIEFEERNGKEIDEAENGQGEEEGVLKFFVRVIDRPMKMVFEKHEQARANREADETKDQKAPLAKPRLERHKRKNDVKSHKREYNAHFFLNVFVHRTRILCL